VLCQPRHAQNNASESGVAAFTKHVSDFVRLMTNSPSRSRRELRLPLAIKGLRRLLRSCSLTKTQRGSDTLSA
jgi:hypothetical protein